jgi:hypothetical protein
MWPLCNRGSCEFKELNQNAFSKEHDNNTTT